MFQKPNTIIACLHSDNFDYILRLNKFLQSSSRNLTTLATENKKIFAKSKPTSIYRPLICFDYNPNKQKQLCFSMTGDKDYHKRGDPRFYFFNSNDKLRVDNPIWIPTKYLIKLEITKLKNASVVFDIKNKYRHIEDQFNQVLANKHEIWDQYLDIKYLRKTDRITRTNHEQMTIRDKLCEKFCNLELEKIKRQELLFAKSKQNESGGSSGTPIEEGKNNKFKVDTSASDKLLAKHWNKINQTNLQQKNAVSHNDDYLQSSHQQSQKLS